MIDIGHKLIEASTFIAHGKWLPWLRAHREAASSFDTIYGLRGVTEVNVAAR